MTNLVAKFYDTMYGEKRIEKQSIGILGRLYLFFKKYELHRVGATVNLLERGDCILDIGCGDGSLLILAFQNSYKKLYGIDISKTLLKTASLRISKAISSAKNIELKIGDLNKKLPYKTNFFDAVTATAVVEHIFDPYFTIKEVHRVLGKDGIFIMEVVNLVWLPRRLGVLFGQLPNTGNDEGWDGGHLHYFTFKTTKKLLEDSGFRIEYAGSTGIFPQIRNLLPSLLGGNILIKARKK